MWPLQEIREQTRRDEEVELRQGTVKWEVEVSPLQINLCSDTAAGRFLLAAQKCQLSGSELATSQRKALCIDMQVCFLGLQTQAISPCAGTSRDSDCGACKKLPYETPSCGMHNRASMPAFWWRNITSVP